jgi:hypothetical protein
MREPTVRELLKPWKPWLAVPPREVPRMCGVPEQEVWRRIRNKTLKVHVWHVSGPLILVSELSEKFSEGSENEQRSSGARAA